MKTSVIVLLVSSLSCAEAFSLTTRTRSCDSALKATSDYNMSRSKFMLSSLNIGAILAFGGQPGFAEGSVTLPSGTSYTITASGSGPKPDIGELAAIRFKATVAQSGNIIDDIFNTAEPYYTRIGSGSLLKGVEEVLPSMRVGDRFLVTIPTNMAFGPKGRPASAGKPRIPGDAIILFDVEMVGLPGKEPELIELIGDD